MFKTNKKLKLTPETIRRLGMRDLGGARGGVQTDTDTGGYTDWCGDYTNGPPCERVSYDLLCQTYGCSGGWPCTNSGAGC